MNDNTYLDKRKTDIRLKNLENIYFKMDNRLEKMESLLNDIVNVINPLKGGGLISIVNKIKWQMGLMWGCFLATFTYSLKNFIKSLFTTIK